MHAATICHQCALLAITQSSTATCFVRPDDCLPAADIETSPCFLNEGTRAAAAEMQPAAFGMPPWHIRPDMLCVDCLSLCTSVTCKDCCLTRRTDRSFRALIPCPAACTSHQLTPCCCCCCWTACCCVWQHELDGNDGASQVSWCGCRQSQSAAALANGPPVVDPLPPVVRPPSALASRPGAAGLGRGAAAATAHRAPGSCLACNALSTRQHQTERMQANNSVLQHWQSSSSHAAAARLWAADGLPALRQLLCGAPACYRCRLLGIAPGRALAAHACRGALERLGHRPPSHSERRVLDGRAGAAAAAAATLAAQLLLCAGQHVRYLQPARQRQAAVQQRPAHVQRGPAPLQRVHAQQPRVQLDEHHP